MKIVILISLIVVIVYLILYIYKKYNYLQSIAEFKTKYNLHRLRNKIQIEKLADTKNNELILKWPKWKEQEVEGKQTNRTAVSELSSLTIGNIKVTSDKPQYIYNIALKLRECGVHIPRCKEEQEKIKRIKTYKKYIEGITDKKDLYNKFKGNNKEFIGLCKVIFTESEIELEETTEEENILIGNIIDEKGESKFVMRCRVQENLEKTELQEFNRISHKYNRDIKIFITTGKCTKGIHNYANRTGIKIVDSEELFGMIKTLNMNLEERIEFMENKKYDLNYHDVEKYYPKDMPYDWEMSLLR